jgi:lambda family phage portal protein
MMRFPFFKRKDEAMTGALIRSNTTLPNHAAMLRSVNGKILRSLQRTAESNLKMARMYQGAITDALNADFPVNISSGNSEAITSVGHVRARARTIERDDPYGAGIVRIYQNNVGGPDPFPLEMRVGKWETAPGKGGKPDSQTFVAEVETNRLVEDAWEEYGRKENCTVRKDMSRLEVYLQMISSVVRDGGWILRHYPAFPNNDFRYAIEPIECDRLDQYYNRSRREGQNEICASIEMDEYHAAVNYWLLTRHPGEFLTGWAESRPYREAVPAQNVVAIFDIRTRAGQYIGMSRLAACINPMHAVRQFDVAHVTAAIWSACKPLFLIQEIPTAMGDVIPEFIRSAVEKMAEGESGQEGAPVDGVSPGDTTLLPFGQKPLLVDPKFPVEAAEGFKADQLRKMATGSGVPYFILAQDWGSLNFTSGRLGLDDFHDTCGVLMNHLIAGAVLPWFCRWLEAAILAGKLNLPLSRLKEFQSAANFRGRSWDYVQPQQDAEADIMLIEAGIKSRNQTIRERGGRGTHEVNAQIAADKACDEAHDLTFTPTKPTMAKGEAGPGPDDTSAPPKPGNNGKARFALSG